MRSDYRAERAERVDWDLPLRVKPWSNPIQGVGVTRHQRVRSFLLLEDGFKDDVLKTVERGWPALDLHSKNRSLPGTQEEFREIDRIELGIISPVAARLDEQLPLASLASQYLDFAKAIPFQPSVPWISNLLELRFSREYFFSRSKSFGQQVLVERRFVVAGH